MADDRYETLLEITGTPGRACAIREAGEALGPPDVLLSGEAVISLYGPEPIHEAQALVDWQPYWGMIQPHRQRRGWSPNVS